jgi:hypothetical protein
MRCVGFEPTIPASLQAKTVHALDRSATVTGLRNNHMVKYESVLKKKSASKYTEVHLMMTQ